MQNIKIAYALSFLWRSWFWLGIWIFYYLKFTDYAGIGLLEAIMITTATLGEIPTGAVADLLGKRKAVVIAFLLGAVGNLAMAIAPNYYVLMASIITMTLGGAFYSGSLEALIYDSLIEIKSTKIYPKVISRITTMQNLGMAVAGVAGGFLYQIHNSLPFLMVAIFYIAGLLISLRLREPKIDSEQYSWSKFIAQNKIGFGQLFATKRRSFMIWLFIIPGSFMIATENVINDATAVELGFNSIQLGIFATVMYLFGVLVSEKSEWIMKVLQAKAIYLLMIMIYVGTLLIMPVVGIVVGGGMLLLRYGAATVFANYESVRINGVIDSKYRATTLSTYNLLKNLPYVLGATFIGMSMSTYGTRMFSVYFAGTLIAVLGMVYLGLAARQKIGQKV